MRRVVAALAGAVLIVIGLTAPATGAVSSSISGWTSTSMTAAVGYAISDGVIVKTGTSYPARTVQLQRRPATATTWTTLATTKTTTTGAYTARYSVPATGTWYFRIYAPATSTATSAVTAARKVVGISGTPTSVSGWGSTAASGAVGYAISDAVTVKTGTSYPTRTIQLQRRPSTSTTWTTLATSTTTSGGVYTARYSVPGTGTWYFRLYVPATTTAAAAATTARKITGITGATTTITGWPTTAASGAVGYTFSSTITIKTGSSYVPRSVTVQRRAASSVTWSTITTVPMNANGAYTVNYAAPATGTWYFRLIVPATTTGAAATSAQRGITGITGAPTSITGWDTTPATLEAGQSLTAAARVQTGTGYTSRTVQVQRRLATATTWTTVVTGTSNSLGGYTPTLSAPTPGTWYFRLYVPTSQTAAAATSPEKKVTAIPPLSWSTRQVIQPRTGDLTSISCPTVDFCAAVDEHGGALTYNGSAWSSRRAIPAANVFITVSCTSKTFCAAVDAGGQVTTYNGSTWTAPKAIGGYLGSVSCASSSLCVALGEGAGAVYMYNGTTWSAPEYFPGFTSLTAVSCTAPASCLAMDSTGKTLRLNSSTYTWSSGPTAPASTWHSGLSCVGANFCAAVTSTGAVTLYNGTTWSAPTAVASQGFAGISCPNAGNCIALDNFNLAWTYTAGTWTSTRTAEYQKAISCASLTFCAAIGTETAATFNGTAWSPPTTIDPASSAWNDISCPDQGFCTVVTSHGEVYTYNGTTWSPPHGITSTGNGLVSISCTSNTFCLTVDDGGTSYTYDGTTWTALPAIHGLRAVSCASPTFCSAANYTFDGHAWSQNTNGPGFYPDHISCPSINFCAAGNGGGSVSTFNGATWSTPISLSTNGGRLTDLACASPSLCIALGDGGASVYNGTSWSTPTKDGTQDLWSVSCPTQTFCAATGAAARTFDGARWGAAKPLDGQLGGTVACSSPSFCVLADPIGGVIYGRRT